MAPSGGIGGGLSPRAARNGSGGRKALMFQGKAPLQPADAVRFSRKILAAEHAPNMANVESEDRAEASNFRHGRPGRSGRASPGSAVEE
jgi:hypothetical protein